VALKHQTNSLLPGTDDAGPAGAFGLKLMPSAVNS